MLKPTSKSRKVHRPLHDVLLEHKKPMTPEQLFHEAGFESSKVDDFYRELTSLRAKLREIRPEASSAKLWPQHVQIFLQLKNGAEK